MTYHLERFLHIQALDRDICLKSTFPIESALLRFGNWWLVFNHYELAHFCFLSDLYQVELLLYPERKELSLASQDSQFFNLLTNWMIRLLLLRVDIHPNSGPQTHKWVCGICLKLITKHQISILCNYTKHWVHLKCFQITTKDCINLCYCIFHSSFNHKTQMNTTSPKNSLKFSNLMYMAFATKQIKYN